MAGSGQVTQIQYIKRVWERIAPLRLADRSWDNVGIMIESPVANPAHRQVLLTIDLTTAVCNEALALPSCSVVIAYHPPIFRGLKSLTLSDPLQSSLLRLASRGISVFTPHTSLDATPNGINTFLARPFDDMATKISEPISAIPHAGEGFEGAGIGRIVKLRGTGMEVSEVVRMVKEHLDLKHVQLATPKEEKPIKSIAVCAGSGASVFKGVEANLFLTGEMSHHEVLAGVASGSSYILTNHSNTERPYLAKVLQPWLEKELNSEGTLELESESGSESEGQDEKDEKVGQASGKTGQQNGEGEKGGRWEVLVSKEDADPLRTV